MRTVLLATLLALTSYAFGQVKVEKLKDREVFHIHVDKIEPANFEIEGQAFTKLSLVGVNGYEAIRYDESQPELPVVRFFVDGDGDIQVTAKPAVTGTVERVELPIVPSLAPLPKVPGARWKIQAGDMYWADEFLPTENFLVEDAGSTAGVPRRQVTLYAVKYNAASSQYKVVNDFDVVHIFGHNQPVVQNVRERETVGIVVAKSLEKSPSLQKYLGLKRSLGYLPRVLVVDKDKMKPQDIRAELRRWYADKTRPLVEVMIVGGNNDVPAYDSTTISGVTDHYYGCLDTDDYDADAGTPDVAVGRFAADNEAELAVTVDKQLKYEAGVFKDEAWLKRLALIASDDFDHWQIAEGAYNYLTKLYTVPMGYIGDFPKPNQPGGDLLYAVTYKATDAQVVDRMREGRFFINYGGHGGQDYWVSPHVERKDVESIKNVEAIPLVMANACNTGDFRDVSMGQIWQWHKFGSILYYGSMDSTYWNEDDVFQHRLYDGMFRDGRRTWADVVDYGEKQLWRHYGGAGASKYYAETYHSFGDPFTHIRTAPPKEVKLVGLSAKPVGTRVLSYQVVDTAGKPLAGARVALVKDGTDYSIAGKTDETGRVELAMTAEYDKPGRFAVTVSGDNLKLFRGTMQLGQ